MTKKGTARKKRAGRGAGLTGRWRIVWMENWDQDFVDEDLLLEGEVWASAGHTHVVFGLEPAELVRLTGGRVVAVG